VPPLPEPSNLEVEAIGALTAPVRSHARDAHELAVILEISQTLLAVPELNASLVRVLEILAHHRRTARSVVVLADETGAITTKAQLGLNDEQVPAYFRGGGMIADVIRTGLPLVIPQVSHRVTFICVPIALEKARSGALAVDFPYALERDYDGTAQFLSVVGSMIGQAIRIHGLIAADKQVLVEENASLRTELTERYAFAHIVGSSREMQDVCQQIAQVAETNTTVILRGESGTGKELFAHAIHHHSRRAKKPFIKVSCAALPQELIESELFGYEKGAFTGAYAAKKGRFELAEGGTLFLDEIGELSLATQIKLLRVLQEREFERLGATETIQADVRIVAATNSDLEASIAAGAFREDLYYRLNVFAIFIPPLRKRKVDIPLLASHFLERFSSEHRKRIRRIATPTIDMLMSYHWPGNVRELENVIERSVVVCDAHVLHAHHLPPTLQTAEASGTRMTLPLDQALAAFEKDLIEDALKSSRGNRAKAARSLATTRRIFNYKVLKYGIDWRRFKS
jgi:Nif-specific regulatory protein